MLLEINLPSRETIVSYLTQSYKAVHTRYAPDKSNAKPLDRVEKILSFCKDYA